MLSDQSTVDEFFQYLCKLSLATTHMPHPLSVYWALTVNSSDDITHMELLELENDLKECLKNSHYKTIWGEEWNG